MAIVEIMGILNFDDDVQFWYTITVLLPSYVSLHFAHVDTPTLNHFIDLITPVLLGPNVYGFNHLSQ